MRIPLVGQIDVTYRCNNSCVHCWRHRTNQNIERQLSLSDIRRTVDEATSCGCRRWTISGGEPFLRHDISDIVGYMLGRSEKVAICTNATLFRQSRLRIADEYIKRLTFISTLYGDDATTHDHITREKGSFNAAIDGIGLMKSKGFFSVIRFVPMKSNIHHLSGMLKLGHKLSDHVSFGASWLHMSAIPSSPINRSISNQRLNPEDVVRIDDPNILDNLRRAKMISPGNADCISCDMLFKNCIENSSKFHIDPTGKMSFCEYITDPELRYDLRTGTFRDGWKRFIPSLVDKVKGGTQYQKECAYCPLRLECKWCPALSYLENGKYNAKIEYLCEIAKRTVAVKKEMFDRCKTHNLYGIKALVLPQSFVSLKIIKSKQIGNAYKDNSLEEYKDALIISAHKAKPLLRLNREQKIYDAGSVEIYRNPGEIIYLENSDRPVIAHFNRSTKFLGIYSAREEKGSKILLKKEYDLFKLILGDMGCFIIRSIIAVIDNGAYIVFSERELKHKVLGELLKSEKLYCSDNAFARVKDNRIMIYQNCFDKTEQTVHEAEGIALYGIITIIRNNTKRRGSLRKIMDIFCRDIVSCFGMYSMNHTQKELIDIIIHNLKVRELTFYRFMQDIRKPAFTK